MGKRHKARKPTEPVAEGVAEHRISLDQTAVLKQMGVMKQPEYERVLELDHLAKTIQRELICCYWARPQSADTVRVFHRRRRPM